MPDERLVLNAFMASLIAKLGGFDGACAVLAARWGHPVSRGTLSKKKAGQLDWTVLDVIALQEAAGVGSVTSWLAALNAPVEAEDCLLDGAAGLSREHGEAMAAVLAATRDPDARAAAIKELRDVIDRSEALIGGLEAQR